MSRKLLLAAVIALSPAVVFAQGATTTAPKSPAVTATAPKSPAVSTPSATVAGDKAAPPAKAVQKVKKSTTAAKATSKPATEEVKPAAPKADTHL